MLLIRTITLAYKMCIDSHVMEPCRLKSRTGVEVLLVARMKMAVFWVVAPCSLVEVYQHFRGPCCLHHQGALMMEAASTSETSVNFYQTTTQKTAIFKIKNATILLCMGIVNFFCRTEVQ
jgi:hypothetical protein